MTERKFKGQSLFAFPSDYTVVDIETNGTGNFCEIIEVSALKCRGDIAVDSFSSLIKPTEPIGWFITRLTGITDDMVKDAPEPADVLRRFYDFVGDDIIIGHNVNFDVNMLYDKLWLHVGLVLDNSFVDTLRLARKALPKLYNHKQTTVAEYYGIATNGAHRAARDCEICHACYQRLKKELACVPQNIFSLKTMKGEGQMTILDKAIIFATNAHSGSFRKSSKVPYIVHPMEVAAIAARMTDDEQVIAAAVLHDVIEDTPTTAEQLEAEFGKRIVALVCSDSENKREDMPAAETWEIRKRETLDYIPKASADEQIIILSDKLANLRSVYQDYTVIGDELWNRFNVKEKSKHEWYYKGIAERLDKVNSTNAYKEYVELLNKVFG